MQPIALSTVPPHTARQSGEQGRKAPSLHPVLQGCSHRGEPYGADTPDVQALRWSYGAAATQAIHPINHLEREIAQGY